MWKCLGGINQTFDFEIFEVISSKTLASNDIKSPFFNK